MFLCPEIKRSVLNLDVWLLKDYGTSLRTAGDGYLPRQRNGHKLQASELIGSFGLEAFDHPRPCTQWLSQFSQVDK